MVLLRSIVPVLSTLGLLLCLSSGAAARPGVEGEAPPRKPLQVFILAGQSNMQGHAELRTIDAMTLDPHTAELLPLMRDAAGEPRVCERVWINSLGSAPEVRTGPLTVGFGAQGRQPKFGPEFTFGLYAEKLLDAPILIIKTAWGGKSLHTDFRPPSAGPFILGERARAELEKKGADVEAAQAERTRASG
ncbi:MAG: sialate O-acetylesterase, partial [Planctomycetota bacterium]